MALSMRSISRLFGDSAPIIGVLLAALTLGGCSAMRIGYNTGPTLLYWWLDSYLDFDSEQSTRVRNDLQAAHDWHRQFELPLLGKMIGDLQTMTHRPVTSEQVCSLVDALQVRLHITMERLTPTIAAIAPTLQNAQLEHMTKEFERRDRKWREEWIDGTLAQRTERRIKQIVERAESFYGPLEPGQVAVVRAHIESSSFDGPRQFREMQRRHQDALQVLQKIRGADAGINPTQSLAEIRELLGRTLKAPSPSHARYMAQLTTESCRAMAALHNSSTPDQRTRLLQTLKGYEGDVRALNGQASSNIPSDNPGTSAF